MCKYRRLGKYAAMALAVCLLWGCSVSREGREGYEHREGG